MASVSTDRETGLRKVQFAGLDGKRRTLRLGKVSMNNARLVCDHVEEIINAGMLNRSQRRTTAEWLADLAPVMLDKIIAFIRQTEVEPAEGWDAVAQRLRSRQLKPAGNAKRGLAAATVTRRCGQAKQFFRDAVRRKLIPSNPFDDVCGGPKSNPENARFIDLDTIAKVIDACPNAEWRLLVALSRFGGLRVLSEPCLLR